MTILLHLLFLQTITITAAATSPPPPPPPPLQPKKKQHHKGCEAAPNCFVRNRHPCRDPYSTCGPCLPGFHSTTTTSKNANTPCEGDDANKYNGTTATTMLDIPVLNLQPFLSSSSSSSSFSPQEEKEKEAQKLVNACTSHGPGFFYIQYNNDILSRQLLQSVTDDVKEFFDLPLQTKLKYGVWNDPLENSGYVTFGHEHLDEDSKNVDDNNDGSSDGNGSGDPKECYNMNKKHMMQHEYWNNKNQTTTTTSTSSLVLYWEAMEVIKNALLDAFTMALKIHSSYYYYYSQDKDVVDDSYIDTSYLRNAHSEEWNTLRLLHYPPISSSTSTSSARQPKYRAGPHSDYGTFTLLLQDSVGGLEIFHREFGTWVPVPYKEGTMVVNVADLFMQWTSDFCFSTLHRVVIPPPPPPKDSNNNNNNINGDNNNSNDEKNDKDTTSTLSSLSSSRYSIVYFVQPNADFVVDSKEMLAKSRVLQQQQQQQPQHRNKIITEKEEEKYYKPIKTSDYLVKRLSATYIDQDDDDDDSDDGVERDEEMNHGDVNLEDEL